MNDLLPRSIVYGALATIVLLGIFLVVSTLIADWEFTLLQLQMYGYFIGALAVGFGVQIGLYTYLRGAVAARHGENTILGVTGTTSTITMLSCCAHYLANILPVLGAVGIVTFVAQFQVELFWVGILFNLAGIAYIGNKLVSFLRT